MHIAPPGLGKLHQAIASEGATSNLFFVLREKEKVEGKSVYSLYVRWVGLTADVATELREVLGQWLEHTAPLDGLRFERFDPSFTPGGDAVIATLPVTEVPDLPGLLAAMEAPGNRNELKRIDAEFLGALWAIAVRVDSGFGAVVYFRRFYGSKVAKVDQPLKFLFRGMKLSKSKTTVVFSFEDKLDALVVGDEVLVLNRNNFEQLFFMAERVYAPRAKKVKKELEDLRLVENFAELSDAIDRDPAKIKKTAEIARNVEAGQLEFLALKEIADEWEIPLELNEKETAFVATPKTTWPLLKLLADDNLESRLTKNKYEVSSKRRIP
jgi:hypothetical protein